MKSNAQLVKDGFGSSSTNFRASSKDGKGQQSTKNLVQNPNPYGTISKKGKEEAS